MSDKYVYMDQEPSRKLSKKFKKATVKAIKDAAKDLDSPSDEDIKILKESGSNSYASENKKIIKSLKKD